MSAECKRFDRKVRAPIFWGRIAHQRQTCSFVAPVTEIAYQIAAAIRIQQQQGRRRRDINSSAPKLPHDGRLFLSCWKCQKRQKNGLDKFLKRWVVKQQRPAHWHAYLRSYLAYTNPFLFRPVFLIFFLALDRIFISKVA